MANQHYLNGQWVDDDNLKISAFDLSVLRGFGTFDYLRTYNFKPFRLEDHLDRFERSNKLLGLTIPISRNELRSLVLEGIKRNDTPNVGVRMVLTGGISRDSITPGEPTLMLIFKPVHKPDAHFYTEGAMVITYPTPRYLAAAKSLSYLTGVIAMQQAIMQRCIEAIYVDAPTGDFDKRRIYEGTRTNFFVIKHGELYTPREDMLAGITRQVVLELAEKIGVPAHEENVYLEEVADEFEEAFISSSDKEIVPIVQIDDLTVGGGAPGPVTKRLMAAMDDEITAAS